MEENKNKNKEHIPEPFELFGIECDKGWMKLIEPVFDYIEKYNEGKSEEEKIQVQQVKEKFGGLRIYTNFGDDGLFKLIDEMEEKSYHVCELCGSEEDVGMAVDGWLTTICLDCLKKNAKQFDRIRKWKRNSDGVIYWVNPDGTMEKKFTKEELP